MDEQTETELKKINCRLDNLEKRFIEVRDESRAEYKAAQSDLVDHKRDPNAHQI